MTENAEGSLERLRRAVLQLSSEPTADELSRAEAMLLDSAGELSHPTGIPEESDLHHTKGGNEEFTTPLPVALPPEEDHLSS